MKGQSGIRRTINAFSYSCAGLAAAFRHEAAFRLEVLLAAILIPAALLIPATMIERAMLIGSMLVVLIVELVNSAIEATIDRISLERHELSRRAKDAGSAAVFVSLLMLASVWGFIVVPKL